MKPCIKKLVSTKKRCFLIGLCAITLLISLGIIISSTTKSTYWDNDANIVSDSYVEIIDGQNLTHIKDRNSNAVLSILEVNESGKLLLPKQLENIRTQISKGMNEKPASTVLIFAHGWHNDASPSQNRTKDLWSFDTLLYRAQDISKEPVMGVYLGWRGESLRFPVVRHLTLDSRRKVARTIGSSTEVRNALVDIIKDARKANPNCKIVFIGHSLGGCLMEKMAHQMITQYPDRLDKTKLPDLFLLMNIAEVAKESEVSISAINTHPGVLRQLSGTRLISPWVISMTSDGDFANRALNPLNGILFHRSFDDITSGFTPGLLTHITSKNTEAKWPKSDGDTILKIVRRSYLEPAFFAPGSGSNSSPIQYGIHPTTNRSNSVGYWNFRIPKETASNHNDIYNVNSLGVALSMLQMADRNIDREVELQNLPDNFDKLNPDLQKEKLLKLKLPKDLKNILRLQKQSVKIRGEKGIKKKIEDAHTLFGRQLWHGAAYRTPYNEQTIQICLDELKSITGVDGIKHKCTSPEDDWRRRYGIRVFEVLKYSYLEPNSWTKDQQKFLVSLLSDNAPLRYCIESTNRGFTKPNSKLKDDPKAKFLAMVNTWLADAKQAKLQDDGK